MATLLQQLGSSLGLGNSEPLVSGNTTAPGTSNAAFHLDVHNAGATGEQVLVAAPEGATLIAANDQRAIMIGGAGDDRMVGSDQADLLIGGGGTNVMSGGGGADVFGHGAGATDVLTDFSPAANERIALPDGVTFTGGSQSTVNPADFGLAGASAPSLILSFSDGSQVVALHTTETASPDWFI